MSNVFTKIKTAYAEYKQKRADAAKEKRIEDKALRDSLIVRHCETEFSDWLRAVSRVPAGTLTLDKQRYLLMTLHMRMSVSVAKDYPSWLVLVGGVYGYQTGCNHSAIQRLISKIDSIERLITSDNTTELDYVTCETEYKNWYRDATISTCPLLMLLTGLQNKYRHDDSIKSASYRAAPVTELIRKYISDGSKLLSEQFVRRNYRISSLKVFECNVDNASALLEKYPALLTGITLQQIGDRYHVIRQHTGTIDVSVSFSTLVVNELMCPC